MTSLRLQAKSPTVGSADIIVKLIHMLLGYDNTIEYHDTDNEIEKQLFYKALSVVHQTITARTCRVLREHDM